MDVEDARTIGARLRQIRKSQRKSLRVIADLSGVLSEATLSRIENGLRALDSRSEIVALANALQIAPSELVKLPLPAPANGDKETAVKAVRRALIAVSRDDPAGQVVPVDVLRTRVEALVVAQRQCEHEQVGRELPELIRDLHTTMAAGRDIGELLGVAVILHVQGSHAFLHDAGAHPDLCWQVAVLARQAAREHGGSDLLSLAAFGSANGLLAAGEFDMAQAELDSVTVPTTTDEAEQLARNPPGRLLGRPRSGIGPAAGTPGRRRAGAAEGGTDLTSPGATPPVRPRGARRAAGPVSPVRIRPPAAGDGLPGGSTGVAHPSRPPADLAALQDQQLLGLHSRQP